jgi:hypothetical protein
MRRPANNFSVRVVGMSFTEDYPDNLLDLEWEIHHAERSNRKVRLRLVRDPKNIHDPNAIRVESDSLGLLGHIPRDLAARLAPELDAGVKWVCAAVKVYVSDYSPDNPGLEVRCKRMEEDRTPDRCPTCGAEWHVRSKTMGAAAGQPHKYRCSNGHWWHEPAR